MVTVRAAIGRSKRDRTRAQIVDAAARVFARMGPDAPNVDDFVSEARIARGTFYNYFETKDDLLVAVAVVAVEAIMAELSDVWRLPDPADRVSCAVRSHIRKAAVNPVWGWTVVRVALIAAPLGSSMRENIARDVTEGIAVGRFHVPSLQVAYDLVLGAGLMGMRSVLRCEAPVEHAEAVAGAVLAGLGVRDVRRVIGLSLSPEAMRRRAGALDATPPATAPPLPRTRG